MSRSVKLVGIDCGSTTTSAIVAEGQLTTGALGRVEVTQLQEVFRSDLVFTPFDADNIDAARIAQYLDQWLAKAETRSDEIFGGGALITGLAAQGQNVAAITQLIDARMAESIVATADDPRLESWLAWMGNCHELSRAHPQTPILNLDIGGGTTNLALGIDGQVTATGCLFVGARHVQFRPGTHQITSLSPYAVDLLMHLHIRRQVGEALADAEIAAILNYYVELLDATISGNSAPLNSPTGRRHTQAAFPAAALADRNFAVALSGGVGQIAYDLIKGQSTRDVTPFGDLGNELAARLLKSPLIADRMQALVPEGLGRATAYGLLKHSTELSGSTLFLPDPERLPLNNVPIVGRISAASTADELDAVLDLAARSTPAAAVQIELTPGSLDEVRGLGNRIAAALEARQYPSDRILVLLMAPNSGKVFGNYATRWGTLKVELLVVDEVPARDAQFVRLGRLREGIVPVWLYAIR